MTTFVTISLAAVFRVNIPAAQLVNLLLTPLEIALVPVFLWFGEFLLRREHVSLSPNVIMEELKSNTRQALSTYTSAFAFAIVGWAVWAPFATVMLHYTLVPLLQMFMKPTVVERPVDKII